MTFTDNSRTDKQAGKNIHIMHAYYYALNNLPHCLIPTLLHFVLALKYWLYFLHLLCKVVYLPIKMTLCSINSLKYTKSMQLSWIQYILLVAWWHSGLTCWSSNSVVVGSLGMQGVIWISATFQLDCVKVWVLKLLATWSVWLSLSVSET